MARVLIALGGALFALPWIDQRLWPVAWLAAMALVAVVDTTPWRAFRRAFLFGFVAHATGASAARNRDRESRLRTDRVFIVFFLLVSVSVVGA